MYSTVTARGHENLHLDPFWFGGRVSKRCLDSYINVCLCCLNTPMLHKSNYTININLAAWNMRGC